MFNPEELAYKEPDRKKFRLPRFAKPKRPSKKMAIILSIVGALLLGGGGFYSYTNLQKQFPTATTENPNPDAPPQQVLGLIESVEKHVPSIPKDEIPSVATVTDLAKLEDQAFFLGAEVGDKVLIYAAAKRAILYRPSTDAIVREAPVELATDKDSSASESGEVSASDSAGTALRIKF